MKRLIAGILIAVAVMGMSFKSDLARLTGVLGQPHQEWSDSELGGSYQWMAFYTGYWRQAPAGNLPRLMSDMVPFETPTPVHFNLIIQTRKDGSITQFALNMEFFGGMPKKEDVRQGMIGFHGEVVGNEWVHDQWKESGEHWVLEFEDGARVLFSRSTNEIWILCDELPGWFGETGETTV